MFPWGHAALGYLVYSLGARAGRLGRPTGVGVAAAVLGSIAPDLIDKPLAWTLDVVPSGLWAAHSVLVGLPIAVGLGLGLAAAGRRHAGVGFSLGYASHLAGDVLFHTVTEGRLVLSPVLWPIASSPAPEPDPGLFAQFAHYLGEFLEAINEGDATAYVAFLLALFVGVVVLWAYDGFPGLRWTRGRR